MSAADPTAPLLDVRGLCKYFALRRPGLLRTQVTTVKAVDGVSFAIAAGTTLGLVGESGCGKTTAARTILRAYRPDAGAVCLAIDGRVIDLATLADRDLKPLRRRMQLIFQDPFSSLNPRMTVERIVGEPLAIHAVTRGSERRDRVVEMLRRVGLDAEQLRRYPHEFSGGQRQRIGIARALILRPALVVADEAVSALDVSVRAQVINLLEELQAEFHLTYIFVAHDLAVVRHIADRVAVMYAGRLVETAPTEALFEDAQHPYTRALLSAVPESDPDRPIRLLLAGDATDPADPARLPPGCAFHPRCPRRFEPCDAVVPVLRPTSAGRCVACHLYGGGETGLYHSGATSSPTAKILCQSGTGGPGGVSPMMKEPNSPAEPTIEPLGSGSAGL